MQIKTIVGCHFASICLAIILKSESTKCSGECGSTSSLTLWGCKVYLGANVLENSVALSLKCNMRKPDIPARAIPLPAGTPGTCARQDVHENVNKRMDGETVHGGTHYGSWNNSYIRRMSYGCVQQYQRMFSLWYRIKKRTKSLHKTYLFVREKELNLNVYIDTRNMWNGNKTTLR